MMPARQVMVLSDPCRSNGVGERWPKFGIQNWNRKKKYLHIKFCREKEGTSKNQIAINRGGEASSGREGSVFQRLCSLY